jgi:6-phosphogluconate dehydrogenase
MVHNAIEYGMMESLAEGYQLLKEGPYKNLDLSEAGEVWQHHSVITSWLNELTKNFLKDKGITESKILAPVILKTTTNPAIL